MSSYIGIPAVFSNSYYYSTYSNTYSSVISAARENMWKAYLDNFFGTNSSAPQTYLQSSSSNPNQTTSLYDILHPTNATSWPVDASGNITNSNHPLTFYNDYYLIQGMFGTLLRNFFYRYAPQNNLNISTESNLQTQWSNFLASVSRDDVTKKQNTIFLWLWELLTQMLTRINDATLTQGGYLLAMTNAEEAAADAMDEIVYTPQSNDQDYATQASNMNLQKQADVLRSQRSANGKQGQTAQSMITSLRDQATQQAQLMTSVMEAMESMYQSIMKK